MMQEKIGKAKIPDEAMPEWITTLHEAGFSDQEIDSILGALNYTYGVKKLPKEKREQLERMVEDSESGQGRKLTPEEKEKFLKFLR